MKVMLLVNLKTAGGQIVPKGSVFSDEYKPLPGFIKRKVGTDLVQVIEEKPQYEIVDPDDFTMEEPEPKLEETIRYVEPVEFPTKKLDGAAMIEKESEKEETEDLSQYEEKKQSYMEEVIEKESKEEELPKKRHSKKKIADHKRDSVNKKSKKSKKEK